MGIKPGDICVIINSANGEKGFSVGKKVKVLDTRLMSKADEQYCNNMKEQGIDLPKSPYDIPHSKLGQIWPVAALDGSEFVSEYGGKGSSIDVPECWLAKLDDTDTKIEKSKELEYN